MCRILFGFYRRRSFRMKHNFLHRSAAAAVVAAMAHQQPPAPVQPPVVAVQPPIHIKLPKFEMQKFFGDILTWKGFWDEFSSAVHNAPTVSAINKFHYLRAQLGGDALKTVSGLQFTAENYQVAVDLLNDRFGRNQVIIEAHYTAVEDLTLTSSHHVKLRLFFDTIEQHLRSLISLGEDVNHKSMVTTIKRKLPHDVLIQIERLKPHDQHWTMDRLRRYLKQELELRETVCPTEKNDDRTSSVHDLASRFHSDISLAEKSIRSTAEALLSHDEDIKPRFPCKFCNKNGHFSEDCNIFVDLEVRQQKLKELHACPICFKSDHAVSDCNSKFPCFHCAAIGKHNRALCPRKYKKKSESRPPDKSKSSPIESGILSLHNEKESSLLAHDESVVMQTALVTIANPSTLDTLRTRLLFDCGSNRTYIAMRLAKWLKLKFGKKVHIQVVTFGTDKTQTIVAHETTLAIQLKDGSSMEINAHIVPIISGTTHRIPYGTQIPSHLMEEGSMADTFPTTIETSPVELLIGQDYYFDLTNPERIQIRPGLHLLGSKLGWILAGRITGCSLPKKDQNLFVQSYATLTSDNAFSTHYNSSIPIGPNMLEFQKLGSEAQKSRVITQKEDHSQANSKPEILLQDDDPELGISLFFPFIFLR